jgi:hypothetical protein
LSAPQIRTASLENGLKQHLRQEQKSRDPRQYRFPAQNQNRYPEDLHQIEDPHPLIPSAFVYALESVQDPGIDQSPKGCLAMSLERYLRDEGRESQIAHQPSHPPGIRGSKEATWPSAAV